MNGQINNIEELMKARLEEYQELQRILENALDNKKGTIWGLDRMEELDNRFIALKKLDDMQQKIEYNQDAFTQDENLISLINDLKNKIYIVKQLMMTLQIKLEGAKETVSMKMKSVVKGMGIKGYKSGMVFNPGSKMCI